MNMQMIEHYRSGNQESYSEVDRAIHDAIFEIAKNKALSDSYNTVQARLGTILFVAPKVPPQWADEVADHEEMMIALEEKDGARFAKLARHRF
jgi:DNA-binding GntR family transcriptional regulator